MHLRAPLSRWLDRQDQLIVATAAATYRKRSIRLRLSEYSENGKTEKEEKRGIFRGWVSATECYADRPSVSSAAFSVIVC